ncbi:MAG: 6-phosphofructokinase [Mitsuokella jalaludinii]|uniref:ATP-dependent 6-phosphofructokinase n=2 Tax=Mitsuokella jalaludinii TaxID=187979 RepID=A0A174BLG7_9FIRM|nr:MULTISPECIES: 6-phosphofructokinase [Mitsuokella]MCI6612455.1 6-phosphofructokinase [Mitsuokella jalaludinii]MCI7064124.1 6-phosphofructokinase [Mitsuokella jalaludinii]MCI7715596.1 6-phosphofructokinase [Mitsuokella jalaludinii]MEE0482083.1 6-phosphofructokinase [Mitsuokella jalaludinii]CUO01921.1 6-phosphofructokinase [Mitsuokella jalaludinii]
MIKKAIAVMTSGGDSPGMNAAARAVVRTALYEGVKVYGINNGYQGMLDDDIEELTSRSVSDLIQRGGTFLGTARCPEFKTPEGRRKGFENLVKRGIEGLVIIGGDGSLTGGSLLSKETGLPIVGLPGTIDNDVWGMDYTIGCDTAANTIVDAINKLRDTASAHRRIMLVEVMGRNSGWLAMMSGIAGGAEFVLVPEVKFNIDSMCEEIKAMYDAGKRYSIIVVAEGAGSAIEIGKAVEEKTGIDTRVSVLGHIQRGGSPTVEDRMKASMLGEKAALAIISGASDIVFGFNEGKVVGVNLFEAVNNTKTLNPELVRLARVLA